MNANNPIGIFDSGVGGLTIWKEIQKFLPQESTVYLADSKNAPYGDRTAKEILDLSIKNCELLIKMNAKIIVVACNTATTNAISKLRKRFQIPIIGIEPALKPAALQSKTKSIGILATKGTLSSKLFSDTAKKFTQDMTLVEVIGKGLVPLIEKGQLDSLEVITLLKNYTEPMLKANVDFIVLGCTHFPFLVPLLNKILPPHITIIDSGEAIAKQTKAVLEKSNLINTLTETPRKVFYTNGNKNTLASLLIEYEKDIVVESLVF